MIVFRVKCDDLCREEERPLLFAVRAVFLPSLLVFGLLFPVENTQLPPFFYLVMESRQFFKGEAAMRLAG